MRRFLHLRTIQIILAGYVILGAIYSLATPIFEASDEVSHYAVIQYVAEEARLPVQQPGVKTAWEQEGSQPPLYYLLMALATKWIDTRDANDRMYPNPHAAPGDPSLDANRNLVIHSPVENFPWQGSTLAVHLIRLWSIGLGAVTVAMGYAIARRVFPERFSMAAGTAALVASNPMFLFISASANNDNLVIALSSVGLYLLVVCWQEPAERLDRASWLRRIALGVIAGCAALTKISGLTLLAVIGLVLTIRHLRRHDWRGWVLAGLLIGVLTIVIAGWWYWRNQALYGDVLGLNTMVAIARPRASPVTLAQLVSEFDGFRYSYWALFGAVNILTFPLAYPIFDALTLIGLIGWLFWSVSAWRRFDRDRAALLSVLAGYVLIIFIGVIRWTMMTPASQGRLMFPAITVISLMLWLGWETIWKILDRRIPILDWGKWALPIFLLAVAVIAPFRDIAPVYAGPVVITVDQVPPQITRLDADYGQTLQLLGYTLPSNQSLPGRADFTLYWQCLVRPDADYSVFVIVYGRGLEEVGKRDAYPYHGLFATQQCAPGTIFADPYQVRLKSEAARPTVLRVQIGLKDWANEVELKPSAAGQPLTSVMFIGGKIGSDQIDHQPPQKGDWRFGDSLVLTRADVPARARPGDTLPITLGWRALSAVPESYTVFVHLVDEQGHTVSQADGPPLNGDYPTSWWAGGEAVVDEHPLKVPVDLPAGNYRVVIGLYLLTDGTRLPIVDDQGQVQPNGQLVLQPAVSIQN